MKLILASQSPRRKELLGLFQIPFTVCAANVDETMDPARPVAEEVARLSRKKAFAVEREPEDVVIAADTVVVLDEQVLGKPRDAQDAYRMLKLLSGSVHQIMTGMTVLRGDRAQTHTEISEVKFRQLSGKEIDAYIARATEKFGREPLKMDITVCGDEVELHYEFEKKPFHRIRRITGYLVGTLDRFNNGKRDEERDRVKHGVGQ